MKDRDKFIVAIKDVSKPGPIQQGKVLGTYRKREYATHDHHDLARRAGRESWQVGIFQNGQLIN